MTRPLVYLAGPVTHHTFESCSAWRAEAADALSMLGMRALDPLRTQHALRGRGVITATVDSDHPACAPAAIMASNYGDIERCDLVIVNLVGARVVSIGTVMEIGFAYALRKRLILVSDNSVHEHVMVRAATSYRVASMHDAIALAASVLAVDPPHATAHHHIYDSARKQAFLNPDGDDGWRRPTSIGFGRV